MTTSTTYNGKDEDANDHNINDGSTTNIPGFDIAQLREIVFRNPNCKASTSEKRVGRLTKRYTKYGIGFLRQLDATCIAIAAEEGRSGTNNPKSTQALLCDMRILIRSMTTKECELYTKHDRSEALKILETHQTKLIDAKNRMIANQEASGSELIDQASVNTDQEDDMGDQLGNLPEIYLTNDKNDTNNKNDTNEINQVAEAGKLSEDVSLIEKQNTEVSVTEALGNIDIHEVAFNRVYGANVIRERVLQLDSNSDVDSNHASGDEMKLFKVVEYYHVSTKQSSNTDQSIADAQSSPEETSVADDSDQPESDETNRDEPQQNVAKKRDAARLPTPLQNQVLTKYRHRFYKLSTQQKKERETFKNLYHCTDLYKGQVVKDIWGPKSDPRLLARWAGTLGRKWDREES